MAKHRVPTIRQKIKIYTLAKSLLIANQLEPFATHCICGCVADAQVKLKYSTKYRIFKWGVCGHNIIDNDMPHNFPELYAYKPEDKPCGLFWWEYSTEVGTEIRLNVIDEIIFALEESLLAEKKREKLTKYIHQNL